MLTARRLYLYVVSGIALALLAVGAATLLRLTLEQLTGARPLITDLSTGDQLAIGLALVIVGLPVLAIHWWLVERTVRGDSPASDQERRSVLRAFYLSLVLAIGLGFLAQRLVSGIEYAVRQLAGEPDTFGPRIEDILAVGAIALAVWAFHAWTRHADVVRGPLEGAAAWLSRFYLYGAIVIGALVSLGGLGTALEATGRELLGTTVDYGSSSWMVSMATASALVVTGGFMWFGHRSYAMSLAFATDFRRDAERASRVRQTADVILFGACAIVVSLAIVSSLTEALRLGLGVYSGTATARLVELIVGPIVTVAPFAIAGWWTYEQSIRDGERLIGHEAALSMRRAHLLVLAGTGLVLTGVGMAQSIAMALETIIRDVPLTVASGRLGDLAQWIAAIFVGLPIWVLAWMTVQPADERDLAVESTSVTRRVYLFLAIGVAVTVLVVALSYILYQFIRDLVGVEAIRFGSEMALAVAAAVVGGVAVAYHLWVLSTDLTVRAMVVAAEPAGAAEVAPAPPVAGQEILLIGPPDADFEAVDRVIREHLPAGYSLRILGPGHAV